MAASPNLAALSAQSPRISPSSPDIPRISLAGTSSTGNKWNTTKFSIWTALLNPLNSRGSLFFSQFCLTLSGQKQRAGVCLLHSPCQKVGWSFKSRSILITIHFMSNNTPTQSQMCSGFRVWDLCPLCDFIKQLAELMESPQIGR